MSLPRQSLSKLPSIIVDLRQFRESSFTSPDDLRWLEDFKHIVRSPYGKALYAKNRYAREIAKTLRQQGDLETAKLFESIAPLYGNYFQVFSEWDDAIILSIDRDFPLVNPTHHLFTLDAFIAKFLGSPLGLIVQADEQVEDQPETSGEQDVELLISSTRVPSVGTVGVFGLLGLFAGWMFGRQQPSSDSPSQNPYSVVVGNSEASYPQNLGVQLQEQGSDGGSAPHSDAIYVPLIQLLPPQDGDSPSSGLTDPDDDPPPTGGGGSPVASKNPWNPNQGGGLGAVQALVDEGDRSTASSAQTDDRRPESTVGSESTVEPQVVQIAIANQTSSDRPSVVNNKDAGSANAVDPFTAGYFSAQQSEATVSDSSDAVTVAAGGSVAIALEEQSPPVVQVAALLPQASLVSESSVPTVVPGTSSSPASGDRSNPLPSLLDGGLSQQPVGGTNGSGTNGSGTNGSGTNGNNSGGSGGGGTPVTPTARTLPVVGANGLIEVSANSYDSVDLVVSRDAGFDSILSFYKVENEQGEILDVFTGKRLLPGDSGYVEAALAQRLTAQDIRPVNHTTATYTMQFDLGSYAPLLIVQPVSQPGGPVQNPQSFFAFMGANPDRLTHTQQFTGGVIGFEDLYGGGDRDYNDVTFKLKAGGA